LAWLVVMNGPRAGKEFRLDVLTDIGRDSRYNPASVEDPTMSRQHARVRLEKEGFVIYDLASANGLLVNGQKEQRCKLANGDRITIGQTVFGFMIVAEDPPADSPPLPPVTPAASPSATPVAGD
jgi:pSer/pThr/pTyr-binding forkhead associated (FHA) protein